MRLLTVPHHVQSESDCPTLQVAMLDIGHSMESVHCRTRISNRVSQLLILNLLALDLGQHKPTEIPASVTGRITIHAALGVVKAGRADLLAR